MNNIYLKLFTLFSISFFIASNVTAETTGTRVNQLERSTILATKYNLIEAIEDKRGLVQVTTIREKQNNQFSHLSINVSDGSIVKMNQYELEKLNDLIRSHTSLNSTLSKQSSKEGCQFGGGEVSFNGQEISLSIQVTGCGFFDGTITITYNFNTQEFTLGFVPK